MSGEWWHRTFGPNKRGSFAIWKYNAFWVKFDRGGYGHHGYGHHRYQFYSFIPIAMIAITVNHRSYEVDASPEMPLLWVLRDMLGLTGTKFGCGVAQCGACTVHLNGEAVRSCVTRVSRAAGQEVVTIEGLSVNNDHPLQLAWAEMDVPQCGYCQSGQLMAAAELIRENPNPTDKDIDDAMSGNICRCGTYPRIRQAIHKAAELQRKGGSNG
jgi:isoquinoline 1-oxidoreductase alpha subunit